MRYSLLSIPGVVLLAPSSVLADPRLWPRFQSQFGSFSSSPATSHQIRCRVFVCLPSHLVTPLWPNIPSPQTDSLTLPVKTSCNCCRRGPALSHHSRSNEGKAEGERETEMHREYVSHGVVVWCHTVDLSTCTGVGGLFMGQCRIHWLLLARSGYCY